MDDEADAREFVRSVMEAFGVAVLEAADGEEGLAVARREKPALIVLDVQMPVKDGFATLYDLRRDPATRDIPVVFLTGVSGRTGIRFSPDAIEEFMGERPEAYLEKPIDPEHLLRTVRRLLDRERVIPSRSPDERTYFPRGGIALPGVGPWRQCGR